MGGFKLGGMTFGSLFKKPETTLYPIQTKAQPEGLKGHVVIEEQACILCGICQKTCPCSAISVDKKERTWAINSYQCVQCSMCIRACPKGCLHMDPSFPKAAASMSATLVEVPEQPKPEKKAKTAEAGGRVSE